MATRFALVASAALAVRSVVAQQTGDVPNEHPPLTTYKCTTAGGCVAQDTSLVLDWGAHPLVQANGSRCVVGTPACPDSETCNENCVVQGINDYENRGVRTSGDAVTLNQYVQDDNGTWRHASPRVYLLDPNGQDYENVQLTGQELTFDVELSTSPCGMNGAVYLSEMDMTGGRSALNPGGAAYGSGYCDAQCFKTDWFNGTVNNGVYGSCCNEMDIWEANSRATGFTPHACSVDGPGACSGEDCEFNGVCDKWGCGFNPYGKGQPEYYGRGSDFVIDTTKKFTVQTQFITDDGTQTGTLIDIRRNYIQDGRVIANAIATNASGWEGLQSITDEYCDAASTEGNRLGGLATQGRALERGSVLIFSLWNSDGDFMQWMDGGSSGPCNATEGDPKLILAQQPDTRVTWSNVRWGDIDSTFPKGSGGGSSSSSSTTVSKTSTTLSSTTKPAPSTTGQSTATTTTKATTTVKPPPSSTTSKPAEPTQTHYGQCGGNNYQGPKVCASPWTCKFQNDWYSQCL